MLRVKRSFVTFVLKMIKTIVTNYSFNFKHNTVVTNYGFNYFKIFKIVITTNDFDDMVRNTNLALF